MPHYKLNILFPIVQEEPYTYAYEGDETDFIGKRVVAPLRNQMKSGIIVSSEPFSDEPFEIKPIESIIDKETFLPHYFIEFISFLSSYYCCTMGETLKFILPNGTLPLTNKFCVLNFLPDLSEWPKFIGKSKLKYEILKRLKQQSYMSVHQLEKELQTTLTKQLNDLVKQHIIQYEYQILEPQVTEKTDLLIYPVQAKDDILKQIRKNAYAQLEIIDYLARLEFPIEKSILTKMEFISTQALNKLIEKSLITFEEVEVERKSSQYHQQIKTDLQLTEKQQSIVNEICSKQGTFSPFVLHGITGSGKTFEYIEVLREVLKQGKTGIILIPEIALTPQTVSRFKSYFGDIIAILHSKMTDGERYDAWRLMRDGKYKIAIGPRSASLAPLPNLGLIVVDEEHEWSYKQSEQVPKYNARDFAVYRGKMANCPVVLGSATPSLESFYNTEIKKYKLLELLERPKEAELPIVQIVDLREELSERPTKENVLLSESLEDAIEQRLLKKEQVILFQNKRGYSTFVQCSDCGFIHECDKCSITLVYHKYLKTLKCHYCGHEEAIRVTCKHCGSSDLGLKGAGTQKIEELLKHYFPHARVLRMDQDTTQKKNAHYDILTKFGQRQADILVGTQMITKGLDFPNVTLVGVLNADQSLAIPDFRSSERTFQLVSQVAGRSGRGDKKGEVIIQTFQPDHYSILSAKNHSYEQFYNTEIMHRKQLHYPPYEKMINIRMMNQDLTELYNACQFVGSQLGRLLGDLSRYLGPAPCPIERINTKYRWHFLIKLNKHKDPFGVHTKKVLMQIKSLIRSQFSTTQMIIDVDPVDLI